MGETKPRGRGQRYGHEVIAAARRHIHHGPGAIHSEDVRRGISFVLGRWGSKRTRNTLLSFCSPKYCERRYTHVSKEIKRRRVTSIVGNLLRGPGYALSLVCRRGRQP